MRVQQEAAMGLYVTAQSHLRNAITCYMLVPSSENIYPASF